MVSKRQIELVQASWAQVAPIGEQAAMLFYDKLFELDPDLKYLFHGDMQEQGKKLVQMIDVAVRGLSHLEAIVPAVQALGRRHAGYGVKDVDYMTVANALLWTLGQGLGPAFTDEVCQAWTDVYMLLATTMQAATSEHELVASGV